MRPAVLQRQIAATDRQIDRLVYELYGLSDEEVKVVQEATGKYRGEDRAHKALDKPWRCCKLGRNGALSAPGMGCVEMNVKRCLWLRLACLPAVIACLPGVGVAEPKK